MSTSLKITRADWTPDGDYVSEYTIKPGQSEIVYLTSSKLDTDYFTIEVKVADEE